MVTGISAVHAGVYTRNGHHLFPPARQFIYLFIIIVVGHANSVPLNARARNFVK